MSVPYLHNFVVLAIYIPQIMKFGGDLTKFWQKQVGSFLADPVDLMKLGLYRIFYSVQIVGQIEYSYSAE